MKRVALASLLMVAGCAAKAEPPARIGMPNPASVACIKAGGKLEIRKGAAGQYGMCHLPDGRVCEEWELFRTGKCVVPTP